MKKSYIILFILIFVFTGTGCIRNKNDPERVINYLKNLDSYTAKVNIKVINEKQNVEYNTVQYYDKNFGYRLELGDDRVLVYKDDKIQVTDIKSNVRYTMNKDFDSLFRLSLLGEYIGLAFTNEEAEYSLKEINGRTFQVLGLLIPGNNRNISSAEIYADLKSNKPEFIIIYDDKKSERVRITYSNFVPDAEINKKLFNFFDIMTGIGL